MDRLPDMSRCPRCAAASARQNLLTSMTRYYVCDACGFRWQLSRAAESSETSPAVEALEQGVHSGTADRRPGPYTGPMQLEFKKAIVASLWVLCSGAVGLGAGVTSPGGLILLASLSLLPALAMLMLWHEPAQTLAESIHEAKR
jgi:rubredoxin